MENYELVTQAVHVDDGAFSGPVVNSPRQLWSVAGYLDMVLRGVFGVEDDGTVQPKLPAALVPMLFGDRDTIALELRDRRRIVLRKPRTLAGGLLVAGQRRTDGTTTTVDLVPGGGPATPFVRTGAAFAPAVPAAPKAVDRREGWDIALDAGMRLYVDGALYADVDRERHALLPKSSISQCLATTRVADGIESLPSPTVCVGPEQTLKGRWPRTWTTPRDGRYRADFRYRNDNGPVNTGITAGVKQLVLDCDGARQVGPIVFPHREGEGVSTAWTFPAKAGVRCRFLLEDGANMSDLAHFAHYTGGKGGASGPLNAADVGTLTLTPAR